MEDTGDLPRAPNAPAELPLPLPGAVAAKPKAQRCLGLAPPLRPAAAVAAASTTVPGTSNGKVGVDTVPHASAAPSGRQRKPPRDPSAPAPPKRAVAKKAPPASARLPAASLQPYSATASSMEPLPASTTWMEHGASSPATVATGALVVLDGMPTRADEDGEISLSSSDDCGSHGKADHNNAAFSGHLGQEPKNKSSDDALKAPKGNKKTRKGRLQQRKFESDNSDVDHNCASHISKEAQRNGKEEKSRRRRRNKSDEDRGTSHNKNNGAGFSRRLRQEPEKNDDAVKAAKGNRKKGRLWRRNKSVSDDSDLDQDGASHKSKEDQRNGKNEKARRRRRNKSESDNSNEDYNGASHSSMVAKRSGKEEKCRGGNKSVSDEDKNGASNNAKPIKRNAKEEKACQQSVSDEDKNGASNNAKPIKRNAKEERACQQSSSSSDGEVPELEPHIAPNSNVPLSSTLLALIRCRKAEKAIAALKLANRMEKQDSVSDMHRFMLPSDPSAQELRNFYIARMVYYQIMYPYGVPGKLNNGLGMGIPMTPEKEKKRGERRYHIVAFTRSADGAVAELLVEDYSGYVVAHRVIVKGEVRKRVAWCLIGDEDIPERFGPCKRTNYPNDYSPHLDRVFLYKGIIDQIINFLASFRENVDQKRTDKGRLWFDIVFVVIAEGFRFDVIAEWVEAGLSSDTLLRMPPPFVDLVRDWQDLCVILYWLYLALLEKAMPGEEMQRISAVTMASAVSWWKRRQASVVSSGVTFYQEEDVLTWEHLYRLAGSNLLLLYHDEELCDKIMMRRYGYSGDFMKQIKIEESVFVDKDDEVFLDDDD